MNVVAYHFWNPTCGPCKIIKPAIEDLKKEKEFLNVQWVSVDTHNDINNYAGKFGVRFVPTIVVTVQDKDGKILMSEKNTGTTMITYYRMIRNALKYITPQ